MDKVIKLICIDLTLQWKEFGKTNVLSTFILLAKMAQWKMIIHFHYPKNEVFSPAVFNILKEPFIVQKETLHQQKALDLSYLDLEGQGRGIVRRAPQPHFVKSKFRFSQ